MVVLENVVRESTKGTTEAVNAKYELMERGGYIPTGYKFDPVVLNARLPLEFFEARNALRIAQSEGAEQYASDSYQHAVQLMNNADEYATSKHIDNKPLIAVSREAVQTAEDARAIAVKKTGRDTRWPKNVRIQRTPRRNRRAQADDATRQKNQAQSDAAIALAAKTQAESDAAQARADAAEAQTAAAQAQVRYGEQQGCFSQRVSAAQADAEQSRLAAQQAQQSTQQAETDKAAMRTRVVGAVEFDSSDAR